MQKLAGKSKLKSAAVILSAWFTSWRVISYILKVLKHEMISNLSKAICEADHVASSISCLKSLVYAFKTYGHTY